MSLVEVFRSAPDRLPSLEREFRAGSLSARGEGGGPLGQGLLTWHRSGFVRESALRDLPQSEFAPAFVLLRLNDWVPEVRAVALRRLQEWLEPDRVGELVPWLPLVTWLQGCGRADHAATLRRITAALRRPEAWPSLLAALDGPARRQAFPLALQAAGDRAPEVVDRALGDPDPRVAAWGASRVRHLPPDPGRSARMRESRLATVRSPGVRELRREESAAAAEPFLLDRSRPVREAARWALGWRSYGDFYGAAVEGGQALRGALPGLAESGGPGHAVLAAAWLTDSRPWVRRLAAACVGVLDAEGFLPALVSRLDDEAPGPAREAFGALSRNLPILPRLEGGTTEFGRLARLRLMARGPRWRGLGVLLRAVGDPSLFEEARRELDLWLQRVNRSFLPPTPLEWDACEAAYAACRGSLREAQRRSLDHLLRAWGARR